MKKLKFIDLFSGCGGFSFGMEQAGHECLLGVDFNKDAIESFKVNHPRSEVYCGDISKLSSSELKNLLKGRKIDMVIGGPPCQGFSTVGRGDTKDDRNTLFKEFVRIVKLTEPEIIMFENVTGMLAQKNRFILKQIFKYFEKLGYRLDARVLSAEEYGVPEKRRRAFIVGVKGNRDILFPVPTHGERVKGLKPFQTVEMALKVLQNPSPLLTNHDISKAQIANELDKKRLSHIPSGAGIRYERDEKAYLPKKLHFHVNWSELRENRFRQTKLQRLDLKKPAPTILTSRTAYYHPVEDRYLTPREAALLQSFPLKFKFIGSQTSVFRQIGNAVPPILGQVLGECARMMLSQRSSVSESLKESRFDFVESAFVYQKLTKI